MERVVRFISTSLLLGCLGSWIRNIPLLTDQIDIVTVAIEKYMNLEQIATKANLTISSTELTCYLLRERDIREGLGGGGPARR